MSVRKGHDRPGILDRDAADFDRTEGVFCVGWQVPVPLGIIEQRTTGFQYELDARIAQCSPAGILVTVGSHLK